MSEGKVDAAYAINAISAAFDWHGAASLCGAFRCRGPRTCLQADEWGVAISRKPSQVTGRGRPVPGLHVPGQHCPMGL